MKRIISFFLAVAMMICFAPAVLADDAVSVITIEMEDSAGDGWDDNARIAVYDVPSIEGLEETEGRIGVYTLESNKGTVSFTIGKNDTVYFFWMYDNVGRYNYEASFTIKRDGATIYTHSDELEECPLENREYLCASEPIDARGTNVSFSVEPTFTVTVPASVSLGESATIEAENVVVPKGKEVVVSLSDANDFKVTSAEGAELTYTVKSGGNEILEGDNVLIVNPRNSSLGESTLEFEAPDEYVYSGNYTGTVTFTVAVKDASTISFTVDTEYMSFYVPGLGLTTDLQAEEGMTWREWLESKYNVDGLVPIPIWGGETVGISEEYDWGIGYDNGYQLVMLDDEIIADHDYFFNITAG